jgi:multidrug resistance efflux pump
MLELLLCSMLTILPDYLYRRFAQGKRLGKEITFYSVWFELRWGITGCLILTVALITTVFYNHPSTRNVTLFFRTIPILPEIVGRVAEVYAAPSGPISQGAPIFRLDSSKQEAAAGSQVAKISVAPSRTSASASSGSRSSLPSATRTSTRTFLPSTNPCFAGASRKSGARTVWAMAGLRKPMVGTLPAAS